jgi:hypothetical protein
VQSKRCSRRALMRRNESGRYTPTMSQKTILTSRVMSSSREKIVNRGARGAVVAAAKRTSGSVMRSPLVTNNLAVTTNAFSRTNSLPAGDRGRLQPLTATGFADRETYPSGRTSHRPPNRRGVRRTGSTIPAYLSRRPEGMPADSV